MNERSPIQVTIYNEFVHERKDEKVQAVYPDGIHETIAGFLRQQPDMQVRTATLDQPQHGLSEEVVASTDVMLWWGHMAHGQVEDEVVERVHAAVLGGMGLIALHSAHYSKIFKKLMGTACGLVWREANEKERLWVVNPSHPIADGIDRYFEIPQTEMYGEYFDIPDPDELVFISWFQGGEVFRSGCAWRRGKGWVFYFRPGHETLPIYHQPEVQRVIINAVRWAAAGGRATVTGIESAPNVRISPEGVRQID
ncbi:MAG: ThuA domain-containing protein [Caldilineales bacterium]|nr:ThuA domain-containing protein [Caldilineales bacterium]